MIEDRVDEYLSLTAAELDARLRTSFESQRRLDADIAAALAVVDQRSDFADDGHRSTHAYVRATINCDHGTARRLVKRARAVDEHPAIGEALHAGHIGSAQADRLARASFHPRAGNRFAEFRTGLLESAEHSSYDDFETDVARFETLLASDESFGDDQIEDRTASVTADAGGVRLHASGGSALQAAEMLAVFRQAEQDQFALDCAARRDEHGDDAAVHPLPRTAQQRRFDAMYSIVLAYVTVPADGVTPRPLVNIVMDPLTAGDLLDAHGLTDTENVFTTGIGAAGTGLTPDIRNYRCETSTGIVIDPHDALRAMLTGHIRRVVVDSAGVVVDMGRKRRLFTGLQRDAAQLLATSCLMDGCNVPAELCEVDHLDEWADGISTGNCERGTDQRNAGPMCGVHNRYKHRARLRARRAADGRIRLIRPDGTVIKPVGERDPVWADADPPFDPQPDGPLRNVVDGGYLVPWHEWIEKRPRLHGVADPGFSIYRIDLTDLAAH